jgi:hypothetical protein
VCPEGCAAVVKSVIFSGNPGKRRWNRTAIPENLCRKGLYWRFAGQNLRLFAWTKQKLPCGGCPRTGPPHRNVQSVKFALRLRPPRAAPAVDRHIVRATANSAHTQFPQRLPASSQNPPPPSFPLQSKPKTRIISVNPHNHRPLYPRPSCRAYPSPFPSSHKSTYFTTKNPCNQWTIIN